MVLTALSWLYIAYGNWLSNTLHIEKRVIVLVLVVYAVVFSVTHWHAQFVVFFHYHFAFMSALVMGYVYCSYQVLKHVSRLPVKRHDGIPAKFTEEMEDGVENDKESLSRRKHRAEKRTRANNNDDISQQTQTSPDANQEAARIPGEFFFPLIGHLMQAPVDTEEKRSIEYVLTIAKFYAHSGLVGLALWIADLELCHYLEAQVAAHYGTSNWVFPVNPQAHAWWHFFVAIHYFCGTTVTLFVGARELGLHPVLTWRCFGLVPLVTYRSPHPTVNIRTISSIQSRKLACFTSVEALY
eukprot:gb/GECG01009774.1/.p1 GENE.gb/GECG01009774.1/~~gb/GECG01009774.1/.p1  ORF type:complete len:297 (+),score=17.76 gb/GECG01009774.1/:1-891(+)